jgi:APA family basic amino acid/polyamine antiporter
MVLALIIVAYINHLDVNVNEDFLFYFSLFFASLHALIYAYSFKKVR